MCENVPITPYIIDARTNPATSVYTSNHLVVNVIHNSNAGCRPRAFIHNKIRFLMPNIPKFRSRQNMGLEWPNRSKCWGVTCCQGVCQNLERRSNSKTQPRGVDTSRDLAIRLLIALRMEDHDKDPSHEGLWFHDWNLVKIIFTVIMIQVI